MSSRNTVITYPVPLYANVPIHTEDYKPRVFFVSAISLGFQTIVTTTVAHDYVIGQLVRLLIPNGFGSRQLNEKTAYVISIPSTTQVTLDMISNNADPFINANLNTKAQIVAVGDVNTGDLNPNGRILQPLAIPGSFINIS